MNLLQNALLSLLFRFEIIASNSWTFQKGWYGGSDAIEKLNMPVNISRYDLWLKPYFSFPGYQFHSSKRLSFEGRVSITSTALEDLRLIQLNSAGLQINQVDLWLNDVRLKTTVKVERLKPILNLQLNENDTVEVNKTYVIKIQYTGKIQHRSVGALYYNDYVDERNFQRTMLATLLEPSKAHRVFPCIDHPTYKAIFQLTLVHPTKAQVFHNTYAENTAKISDQLSSTIFKPTKRMSTYLFAFAIGDFAMAETTSKSGVKVRTIALKQFEDSLPASAKIAASCIDSMESLLGVDFPLEKLDHLESPNSLVGGMENIGLIIYRGLLSVPPNVSSSMRLTQKLMICHETAHQWFSGMVTAKDWSQMLLHESFAQFFMYKAVREMTKNEKDQQLIETAFIDEREGGLQEMDKLRHSIIDDHSFFDVITYKAGAAFIQMMESALGKETFYKGLQHYLNKHKYLNADHGDLISAFEHVSKNKFLCGGITIRNFMQDYLFRPTYPILQIEASPTRIHFNQRASDDSDLKWDIPMFVRNLATDEAELLWLRKDGSLCNSGTDKFRPDPNSTYSFNTKGRAFVRVEHSEDYWSKLIENAALIDATTQYTLIMDLLSGKVSNNGKFLAQKFIESIVNQTGTLPPVIASQLHRVYDGRLVVPVVEQICESAINWDPETLSQGYLTRSVLRLAAEHNLCNVSSKIELLLKDFLASCFGNARLDKCNKLNGDIREAVYCYAAKNRHRPTLSNYLFWLNSMPNNLQFEYDEIPNVKHGLKCHF